MEGEDVFTDIPRVRTFKTDFCDILVLWVIIQSTHTLCDQFLNAGGMARGTALDNSKGPSSYRVRPTQHSTELDEVLQPSSEVVIRAEDQNLLESSQMEEMEN